VSGAGGSGHQWSVTPALWLIDRVGQRACGGHGSRGGTEVDRLCRA